eukprot:TRINITY_DN1692_c0_g1_i1.p1 TRINITY_DN1692_c0_g1~~TRINITY_DN1692_c0_g1_i1.p1  ORF type:complete len:831 (+),score=333.74 TRINITY_DN1692_c0_g1_i1:60-2552(+)
MSDVVDNLIDILSIKRNQAEALLKQANGSFDEAINIHQKNNADSDLQAAIQQSLQQPTIGFSNEDFQLNQAIEFSIKSANEKVDFISNISPKDLVRDKQLPSGLRNVSATCYLNAFIQTFLRIPEIRDFVLKFKADQTNNGQSIPSDLELFMKELQFVFANLLKTEKKFVDPTLLAEYLLRFVKKDNNTTMYELGNQQDVAEMNDLFLSKLAEAASYQMGSSSDDIDKLFKIQMTVEVDLKSSTKIDTMKNIIVYPNPNISDLYEAIDKSVEQDIESAADATKKKVISWIDSTELPRILLIQQSRVTVDKVACETVKINSRLEFTSKLSLDRYLLDNKSFVSDKRRYVDALRQELSKVNETLKQLTTCKETQMNRVDAIQTVINIANEKNVTFDINANLIIELENMKRKLELEINDSSNQKSNLLNNINDAYSELIPQANAQYLLIAVWIHSGAPSSGHYWTFVASNEADKWLRFDDAQVKLVDNKEMESEAFGGNRTMSASFLIYLRNDCFNNFLNQQYSLSLIWELIPVELTGRISNELEDFKKKLAEHEKKQLETNISPFISKLDTYFAKKKLPTQQLKFETIKNVYLFFFVSSREEFINPLIFYDSFKVWPHELAIEDTKLAAMISKYGRVITENMIETSRNQKTQIEDLFNDWQLFVNVLRCLELSLTKFIKNKLHSALDWVASAIVIGQTFKKIDIELVLHLKSVLKLIFEKPGLNRPNLRLLRSMVATHSLAESYDIKNRIASSIQTFDQEQTEEYFTIVERFFAEAQFIPKSITTVKFTDYKTDDLINNLQKHHKVIFENNTSLIVNQLQAQSSWLTFIQKH